MARADHVTNQPQADGPPPVTGLVPLVPFWELAFALSAGVLIDSFVVRSYMVPGMISLFGEASWWPWRRRPEIPERYDPAHATPSPVSSNPP